MPILDRRQSYTPSGSEEDEEVKDDSSRDEEETSPEDASTSNDDQESEDESEEENDESEDEADEDESEDESEESEDESEGKEPEDKSPAPPPSTEPKETELDKEAKALEAIRVARQNLLEEIEGLRAERRVLRGKGSATHEPQVVVDKPADDLADIDPTSKEVIERVLRAQGYVKKEEIQAETQQKSLNATQDAWLQQHPEYLPANDPNDERWTALCAITKMFATPKTPQELERILSIAHRELNPTVAKPAPTIPQKSRAETNAKTEKIKISSKTGGNGGAKTSTQPSKRGVDRATLKAGLIGFSDEELDELVS